MFRRMLVFHVEGKIFYQMLSIKDIHYYNSRIASITAKIKSTQYFNTKYIDMLCHTGDITRKKFVPKLLLFVIICLLLVVDCCIHTTADN